MPTNVSVFDGERATTHQSGNISPRSRLVAPRFAPQAPPAVMSPSTLPKGSEMTRPMTLALDGLLNSMSASDRRVLHRMSAETAGQTTMMSRLLRAFALEVRVLELDEDAVLRRMALERQADLDARGTRVDPPAQDGPAQNVGDVTL